MARLGIRATRVACPEDALQLVGRRDLQLIVAAVLRALVGTPAHELRCVPEAGPLHVFVRDLADAFGPQRLPAQVLTTIPAAPPAPQRRPLSLSICLSPLP